MSERSASVPLFLLCFLLFAEFLSWETASWPGPCVLQVTADVTVHDTRCPTFHEGIGILLERSDEFMERHDKSIIAAFTVVLAISTIGLWLATVRLSDAGERQLKVIQQNAIDQSRDMKASIEVAIQAAEAAKEGALASRDSATIAKLSMVAQDRAYVHYSGCRWISHHQGDEKGPIFWRIRPTWTNMGNTPTRNLRVYADYELRDSPLPKDYQFVPENVPQVPGMLPPKGRIESGRRDFFGPDLAAVKEGKKYLYIWGIAKYMDVFPDTPERITEFCVIATSVTGNPVLFWDEKNNNVEITFATYERHNCTDEECIEDLGAHPTPKGARPI